VSRVVVLAGSSSGIGRAIAQQLARKGDHLVLLARGAGPLEDAAGECRRLGAASVVTAVVSVVDADEVDRVVQQTVDRLGRIDAVVHSAGVVAYGRFEEIPKEVFDAVLETNVIGAANMARSVLPVLRRQQHGTVVLVGSVLGNIAVPTMTPYVVSKWALRALGRQLALENRDLAHVRICTLSPGGVDTPIYAQAANYLGHPGRPPAPVDSAHKVASRVVRALDAPRDRVSVGLANPLMRLGFTIVPRVFDAIVGPVFRAASIEERSIEPTTGNVLFPDESREAVDGGQGQGMRTTLVGAAKQLTGRASLR
jgi:NAD(P)-dependent dehydrogenase (short-subunit alcohol dehydrogenase family)